MAYTTIVTGTTITSAWANADVRDQVVVPFASTAARSSAITAPVAGQVSTLTTAAATEGLYAYTSGGDWLPPWNMPWGRIGSVVTTSDSSGTTTTASWATLTVTWTPVAGRIYRVSAYGTIESTANGDAVALDICDASNNIVARATGYVTIYFWGVGLSVSAIETELSGSTERKVRVTRVSGSGTVKGAGAATLPAYVLVEDIGPAGGPP